MLRIKSVLIIGLIFPVMLAMGLLVGAASADQGGNMIKRIEMSLNPTSVSPESYPGIQMEGIKSSTEIASDTRMGQASLSSLEKLKYLSDSEKGERLGQGMFKTAIGLLGVVGGIDLYRQSVGTTYGFGGIAFGGGLAISGLIAAVWGISDLYTPTKNESKYTEIMSLPPLEREKAAGDYLTLRSSEEKAKGKIFGIF